MPNFVKSNPSFWTSQPERLREVQQQAENVGLKVRHFIMGDPDLATTPTAVILEMPPNYVLPRHAHACDRCEVIVSGSLEVDGSIYGPGDVMQNAPGEFYGPHIAGPDGCTTVEIFSSIRGNGKVVYEEGRALR